MVSHQNKGIISVYDSLPNRNRVSHLTQQLLLLYELLASSDNHSNIKYVVAQHQGKTNDCGAFAAANAYFLTNGINPQHVNLFAARLRGHLQQCFLQSKIMPFPFEYCQKDISQYMMHQYFTHALNKPSQSAQASQKVDYDHSTNIPQQPVSRKHYFAQYKRQQRQHASFAVNERQRQSEMRRNKREKTKYREPERHKDHKARKKKRKVTEYREPERQKDHKARKKKRKVTEYREPERQKDHKARKKKRKVTEYREPERQKDHKARKKKRKVTEYREPERQKEQEYRKKKRKVTEYREPERLKDHKARKKKRKVTEYREPERQKEQEYRKKKRKVTEYREPERQKDRKARKSKRKQSETSSNKRTQSALRKLKRKGGLTLNQRIQNFRELLCRGDDFVCTCCHQTFYQHSVYPASKAYFTSKGVSHELITLCLTGYISTANTE